MKSKEELTALKAEVDAMERKLSELSEDELGMVVGGGFWEVLKKIGEGISNTAMSNVANIDNIIKDIDRDSDT